MEELGVSGLLLYQSLNTAPTLAPPSPPDSDVPVLLIVCVTLGVVLVVVFLGIYYGFQRHSAKKNITDVTRRHGSMRMSPEGLAGT